MPIASGRESDPKGIDGVNLKMIFEMFKDPDESERRTSVAVEKNQMGEFGISNSVKLVDMLVLVDGHISEL